MTYRRPHPVRDGALAARRLLEARTALIELVLGRDKPTRTLEIDGELAVKISNAIETLEAAAENYGAIGDYAAAPPVTPEELADVRRCIDERSAELAARTPCGVCRGSGVLHCEPCGSCGGLGYHSP